MAVGRKYDYPPLLPPGRHYLTLSEISALCTDSFPHNACRSNHFYRLEQMCQDFLLAQMPCQFWLDGSFLTEKPEPHDLDITVVIEQIVLENLNDAQRTLVDRASIGEYAPGVDSFVLTKLARDHPDYGTEADTAFSWGEQYGRESGEEWLKGFVVLRLWETDVGLRICR